MSNWICKYCGKDTSDVDYDYLDGFNHLGCTLEALTPKKKAMKIKGWEKISGYTYKGMSIVNPIHNAEETKYSADLIDISNPQNGKWELSVLMPDFKFKQDSDITIILWDENKYRATKSVSKNIVSTLTGFRILFEDLVDEVLKLRLTSAPSSSSFYTNGTTRMTINSNGHATIGNGIGGNGIINVVNSSGTSIDYSKVIAEMAKAISSDKSLSNQFKDIIKEINDL